MNRRTIPGKLLVIKIDEPEGAIIKIKKKTEVVRSKVFMAGRAPEEEAQIEDGQIIQHLIGGQSAFIDDVDMTLIDWSQILYIE